MSHMDDGMLHTYLDGELGPAGEAQLREHLATCADCRGRLDQARDTRSRAHEILRLADPIEVVQPDFAAVLARRATPATATEPVRRRPAVRPLLLPWAASLVLAVGAGWFAQSVLTRGGAGGGAEQVATMQGEESVAAPAADAVALPEAGDAARVFSADAAESAPPPPPSEEAPLAAVTPEAGAPQAATMRSEAPPAAGRDADVGAAGAQADAVPTLLRGRVADLSTAAKEVEEPGLAGVPARTGAEMQAAAPPPPPPSPATAGPAAWPTTWTAADAAGAAEVLGEAPVVIAALPVDGYQVSGNGSGAVRVLQRLPGGEPVELLQRRAPGNVAGFEAASARPGVEILIRANVSADSLERLRAAVR